MESIYITDIFWDRVFLNVIITGENLEKKDLYLSSKNDTYKLSLTKIENQKYQAIINITNIENGKMLGNKDYTFRIKMDKKDKIIEITDEVGYKLVNLDKVYRYGNECYAYTVNFDVEKLEDEKLTCILKSRYMKMNFKPEKCSNMSKKNNVTSHLKTGLRNFIEASLQILYNFFSTLHFHKKNHILFMSETRAPISGNLKALDQRIKERKINETYKISYSFSKSLEQSYFKLIFQWIKTLWKMSKQSFIFIDDYSPLLKFICLSPKTKLIQVWHAGVGFKSVGYARFGFGGPEPYNSCHRKYDYAIVGSKALIPVYEEVFGISKDKILPYGLPRLDNFLQSEKIDAVKDNLYKQYPELKEKKVILFAPTFRGKGQKEAYYPFDKIDLDKIFKLCEEKNDVFIVKMHPFIKEKINIPEQYKSRIKDFSNYPDINELLYITDILITDYSSNIYDYSLLNRPIILYAFDLSYYELVNKIQRPVEKYAPGKVCQNFEDVINTIKNEDFRLDKLEKYRQENFDNIGKSASDLIIDNIILKGEKDDKKNTNNMC